MIKTKKEFKDYEFKIELSKDGFFIDYLSIKNSKGGFWLHINKRLINIKINNVLIELWLINFIYNIFYFKKSIKDNYLSLCLGNLVLSIYK